MRLIWAISLYGFKNIILPILSQNYVSHGNPLIRIGNVRQKESTSTICIFNAKVQEKQNRKLGKFFSSISLEM